MMRIILILLLLSETSVGMAAGDGQRVDPYIDPAQLDCPFPKHSFYKQPWRGFLETRSGYDFLHGIGINYNVPAGNDDLAVRLLAESGFKCFRIEIGWSSVDWDEQHLGSEPRWRHLLAFCKQYGIRPTLLLNANHGAPCPTRFFDKQLGGRCAHRRSDRCTLTDTQRHRPRLQRHQPAHAVLGGRGDSSPPSIRSPANARSANRSPRICNKDQPVSMATLKYLPLYPVGTPEYEQTAAGWIAVCAGS